MTSSMTDCTPGREPSLVAKVIVATLREGVLALFAVAL